MASKSPTIEVRDRDFSVNPRRLRREGRLPATYYGKGSDPVSFDVDKKSFTYLYYSQNPNLILLDKQGEILSAMVKTVQIDPVSGDILNIEFLQIKEGQKVKLSLPLVLENESPAVKTGGVLLQLMNELEVECLPKNIPDAITFDISGLDEVGISITVGDIKYPEGVVPSLANDVPILNISSPKAVAEEGAEEGTAGELTVTPEVAAEVGV
jgi:large subunit ribosomal protein L25